MRINIPNSPFFNTLNALADLGGSIIGKAKHTKSQRQGGQRRHSASAGCRRLYTCKGTGYVFQRAMGIQRSTKDFSLASA